MIAGMAIRLLLALASPGAAGAKVAFQQIRRGQAFRYVTAPVEIVGGVGLFLPGKTVLAALWLARQ